MPFHDAPATSSRRPIRSALAVIAGLILIVVLSLGTDQLFHSLGVYPPWGEPILDPILNGLALVYRIVYAIIGCYVTASLAPYKPLSHAMGLGVIGVILYTAGAITTWNVGPNWYPIALIVAAIPASWIAGRLYIRNGTRRI
jgi:hypothetical protein